MDRLYERVIQGNHHTANEYHAWSYWYTQNRNPVRQETSYGAENGNIVNTEDATQNDEEAWSLNINVASAEL
jgi:hypothetical protein